MQVTATTLEQVVAWLMPVGVFVLGAFLKGFADRIQALQRSNAELDARYRQISEQWAERQSRFERETLEHLQDELIALHRTTARVLKAWSAVEPAAGGMGQPSTLPKLVDDFDRAYVVVLRRSGRIQDEAARNRVLGFAAECRKAGEADTGRDNVSAAVALGERLIDALSVVAALLRRSDAKMPPSGVSEFRAIRSDGALTSFAVCDSRRCPRTDAKPPQTGTAFLSAAACILRALHRHGS